MSSAGSPSRRSPSRRSRATTTNRSLGSCHSACIDVDDDDAFIEGASIVCSTVGRSSLASSSPNSRSSTGSDSAIGVDFLSSIDSGNSGPIGTNASADSRFSLSSINSQAIDCDGSLDTEDKTWEIVLKKTDTERNVGIVLELAPDFLCVHKKPKTGLIKKWNDSNPNQALLPGDIVSWVNGHWGPTIKILEAFKTDDVLRIRARRFETFAVMLPPPSRGKKIGADLKWNDGEKGFEIKEVNEGLFRDWNDGAVGGKEVGAGDFILRANDSYGKQEIFAELQHHSKGTLLLIIKRGWRR